MSIASVIPLVRDAVRGVRRSPGSSLLVVSALALGIGATTAVFSVVDAVLFRPLQAERPDELVRIVATNETHGDYSNQSFPVYTDYRDQSDAFVSLAAFADWTAAHLSVSGRAPERVSAALVTANFFDVLSLRPQVGRLFRLDEDRPGSAPIVVLADRTYRRRFGADPAVVGSTVRINGHPFTVVGVAPRGFVGVGLESVPEMWIPVVHQPLVDPEMSAERPLETRSMSWLDVVGRLRPGVSIAAAQAGLDVIAKRRAAAQPEGERDPFALVIPASEAMLEPGPGQTTRRLYGLLLGVAALVLLVACADVAGLLLARGEGRQRELAIRMAVGASRGHVVRQLLAEALVLSTSGAALGALLAAWGTDALVAAIPPEVALPIDAATSALEPRVLAVAAIAGLLSGLLAGLVPALRSSRPSLLPALRDEAGATAGRGRVSLRSVLVVSQVALSCVLLVGAGLLVRTLLNLNRLDTGLRPDGLVLASYDLARQGYDEARAGVAHERLLEAIRGMPGVLSVSVARSAPVQSAGMRVTVDPEGYTPRPGEMVHVDFNVVSPGHFGTLGVPLLRGRDVAATDREGSPPVVVVSQSLADRFWPDQDPIGKELRDLGPKSGAHVVVGVVADIKLRKLTEDPRPIVYVPLAQWPMPRMTLSVRTSLPTREAVASLRAAVARVDPELPLFRVRTLEEQIQASLARERLLAALFSAFGALALLLSWAGLYGLVSFVTAQRTREIGLRMALGADAADVVRLVVGQSLRLSAVGLVVGLGVAVALARLLDGVLYGVRPSDLPTLAFVSALALVAGAAAGHIPARRAVGIEPIAALRHE
jgi:putative ABC transport system permease protein